jgi:drug/metabolite transporter (DMT)-like permease
VRPKRRPADPPGERPAAAYVAAVVTTILWGTQAPLLKLALAEMGFISLAGARAVVSIVPLVGLLVWQQGWKTFRLPWADALRMAALGGVVLVVCQASFTFALTRLPASISVILVNTSPIFTAVLAVAWLREPLRRARLAGMLLSFGGVVLLVARGGGPTGPLDLLGVAGALLGSLTWATFTVAGRDLLARYDPLRVAALTGLASAIGFLPLALLVEPAAARAASPLVWGIVVYLGVLPIALGNVLWYGALRTLRAAQLGSFQYLVPLWSIVLAALLLGEALTPALVGGGAFVLLGLWLAQRR